MLGREEGKPPLHLQGCTNIYRGTDEQDTSCKDDKAPTSCVFQAPGATYV